MLRIGLQFPDGWEVVNTAETVMAREPGTQHFMLLQQVAQPRGTSIEQVAYNAMRSAGYTEVGGGERTRIGGQEAYMAVYRGNLSGVGRVMMRSAHIGMGRQVYVVAGFAPEKEFELVDRDIQPAVRSFRELSQSEASQIRPNKLAFYTTRPGDSWQSIAQRAGKGITSAATLAIMNHHEVFDQPQPGERIKIVVEG
jgi:predicted Zn-dependent protease